MNDHIKVNPKNYSINPSQIELFAEEFYGKVLTEAGTTGKNSSIEIGFEDTEIDGIMTDGYILSQTFKQILDLTYKLPKDKNNQA